MKLCRQSLVERLNRKLIPAASGFTLIEMMIVLGIIAIIMTIGLPAFVVNRQKTPMRNSVNDVVDACRNAREIAIYTGEPMDMVLRSEDYSLSVQKAPAPPPDLVPGDGVPAVAEAAPAPVETASPVAAFSGRLAEGIEVRLIGVNLQDASDAGDVHVRFYPNGTSDEFALHLRDGNTGEEQLITTEVITGRVDVKSVNDPSAAKITTGSQRVLKMK